MRKNLAALAALALAGCATTPSGPPPPMRTVFYSATPQQAVGALTETCITRGYAVVQSGANFVQCQVPFNAGQSLAYQLALGNAYSTPPAGMIRFTAAPTQDGAIAQATLWVETQMAFGQTRSAVVTNRQSMIEAQAMMDAAARRVMAANAAAQAQESDAPPAASEQR